MIESFRHKVATLDNDNHQISEQIRDDHAAFESTLAESDAQHDFESEQAYKLYESLKI